MSLLTRVLLLFEILAQSCCHCDFKYKPNIKSVTIGMVRNGRNGFSTEALSMYNCNVTFLYHDIDIAEPFYIYKSVQHLESHEDVDAIVVLDDIGDNMQYVKTQTVPLITWGATPSYTRKVPRVYRTPNGIESPRMCQMTRSSNVEKPYCLQTMEVNDILRHTDNKTVFKGKVQVDGPGILSAIITRQLAWKEVIIIHEYATEYEAAELVDQVSMLGVRVIIYNLDELNDVIDMLLEAYLHFVPTKSELHFVVLCSDKCLRRLFHEANRFDRVDKAVKTLLKQFSHWLIASYDHAQDMSATLGACAEDLNNIAIVAFPKMTKENTETSFRKALQHSIIDHIVDIADDADVIDDDEELYNVTDKIIQDLQNNALTWRKVSQCEGIRIDTLMWKEDGRRFNNVGFVTKSEELIIYAYVFPNAKFGYNGLRFRVSTLHYPPFVVKEEINDTIQYGGICMDLLQEFALTLNFTYTLTEPPDGKWGSPGPNLEFNGMIGQLQREEVDMVAADITIQKEREMVMDFMFPFFYGDTSVLLKKPDPNARKWRTLVDPLKWEVLMAIGICLPIVSLMAFLIEKFNPFYNDPKNAQIATVSYGLHTFHDAFWYMYGALLSQGGVNLPDSVAGRTFVSCWWLFCIVIVGTYCGNLIAFLTVTKDKPPFETLNEMVEMKGTYKWGLQAGTNWEHVFKTSNRTEYRKVGDAIIEFNKTDPSVMATDVREQLAKVREGNYGWIGDSVIMEMEMVEDCDLMMIKERFLPLKYAFGFKNNSPHVQIFTRQMLSIHESGVLQVWKRRWWPKSKSICAGSIIAEAKPIKLIDVQSAFYVAAGGALIGFIAFVLEVIIGHVVKKRRTTQSLEQTNSSNQILQSTESAVTL
ncbi:hypothetical protein ACF0H5_018980 [Mactra antiquata]